LIKKAKIVQSRDFETKINKHMGINEMSDFPSFEGLDETATTIPTFNISYHYF
jgi:hypothetical protein